jgi:hypothetical protein
MSIPGQDWSFFNRTRYSDGRQNTSAIVEKPFLAEIGHSSFGKMHPFADTAFATILACPFLAKIAHSSIGQSSPTPDCMLPQLSKELFGPK